MNAVLTTSNSPTCDLQDEQTWAKLICSLRGRVRHFVYAARVGCWQGQVEDVFEDVVQETLSRIFEYGQRVERGEALPIDSLEHLALRIARNFCTDMLRRDGRLRRIAADSSWFEDEYLSDNQTNSFEMAIERVSQEEIFTRLAHLVAGFPEKRRRALLIDLANRMCFERELTPLQKAFLSVGIDFREFRQALPADPANRAKHAALKSLAYKQITTLMQENAVDQ